MLIGLAIKVCAIDVLESISIAKALAYRNSYELECAPPAAPVLDVRSFVTRPLWSLIGTFARCIIVLLAGQGHINEAE